MTVGTMRTIDRFAGIPLCLLTGIWHSVFPARAPKPGPPATILVMKFFGIGSVLLSTVLLDRLRRLYPGARILYLSFASSAEILRFSPSRVQTLTIEATSARRFVRDTFAALRTLRQAGPDVVFDLEFFSKFSTLISALSGAPVRVGFSLPARWRRMNVTHAVKLDHRVHVTAAFLRQLSALGENGIPDSGAPSLRAGQGDRNDLQCVLPSLPGGRRVVCINVNAGATSLERRWAPERFRSVLAGLARGHPGTLFCFTGTADERSYVESVLGPAGLPDSVNVAGRLTLGGLIALFECSALLITADSGPMHIAAAVGLPFVALFGPESPDFYGPRGTGAVITRRLSCSPCLTVYNAKLFACPYHARCMSEITVDEVLQAADDILTRTRGEVA